VDLPGDRFPPDTGNSSSGIDAGNGGARIQIQSVIDGDTIILSATADAKTPDGRNLSGETVRMLGVDAPEIAHSQNSTPAECWGDESHQAARNLMQGLTVELAYDCDPPRCSRSDLRDSWGRLLAYIILPDGRVGNEVLIEKGDAFSFDSFNHRYRSRYEALEKKARDRNLGVWTCQ